MRLSLYEAPTQKKQHKLRTATTPGIFTPYSFRIVCGFFNVPHWTYKHVRYCETGPTVYSPYPRRLQSHIYCWCNYKGSTFYSVILRPWVLVRPESNSWPPAWQPDAQLTEPPCAVNEVLCLRGHHVTPTQKYLHNAVAVAFVFDIYARKRLRAGPFQQSLPSSELVKNVDQLKHSFSSSPLRDSRNCHW